MIEWVLIGLLAGLVAGLGVAFLSQRKTIRDLREDNHGWIREAREAHEATDKVRERMIEQVIMLRRDGFQTIPEDEQFDAYLITSDQEANWELQRKNGIGEVVPQDLAEG